MTPPIPVEQIEFVLNGEHVRIDLNAATRLLDLLRSLGATGAKEVCGEGQCGACTVLLDGLPALACTVPACQARGRVVETVESVDPEMIAPLLECGAVQCGMCTPGIVMTAVWLRRNPDLAARFGLKTLLAGNLCRCTGYQGIIAGVQAILDAGRAR